MTGPERVLRRRNGRPQACDPCRSRKVACDHSQPVCLRCRKRDQANDCVYTISSHSAVSSGLKRHQGSAIAQRQSQRGVTSISASSSPSVSRSPVLPKGSSSSRVGRDPSAPLHRPPASSHTANGTPKPITPTSGGSSTTTNTNTNINNRSALPIPSFPGYLGSTSYCAVFEETSHSLSRLQGTPSLCVLPQPATEPDDSAGRSLTWTLTSPTREMCFVVLRSLPSLADKVIKEREGPHPCDGWVRRLASRVLSSFQELLASIDDLDDDARIEEIARMLCVNSSKPVADDAVTADEWSSYFIGDNLRWESLGLLITFGEIFNGQHIPQTRLFRVDAQAGAWEKTAVTCIGLCIELAKCFSDGNLLLVHLCSRRTVMESMVVGDAGLACWRAHAESVALVTFMGLHAEVDSPSYVPTFGSELGRRMFAYVYNLDKVAVAFSGRPPLLSSRYVSTPLPLDIPDRCFVGDEETFRLAVSEIDERGWNPLGELTAAAFIRARASIAWQKDELLALALSNNKHFRLETLLDIKAQIKELVDGFPPFTCYNPDELEDYSINDDVVVSRMILRIEHLQALFFAERLLSRRSDHPDDDELLFISFDMVSLTLLFWMHRDRFTNISADLEWLVMNFAAPGAGILCNQLLRPSFSGQHHPHRHDIKRSAIIQQLSLLVGFLSGVTPGAPNADLCASCRTVIQHVLDHTLNSGPVLPWHQQQEVQDMPMRGDSLDHFADEMEGLYFNFDLMDTFDWLRSDDMGAAL